MDYYQCKRIKNMTHKISKQLLKTFILANLCGAITGAVTGFERPCEQIGVRRYHYIIPSNPGACIINRWLLSRENIYRDRDLENYHDTYYWNH